MAISRICKLRFGKFKTNMRLLTAENIGFWKIRTQAPSCKNLRRKLANENNR
jgi:hypothetical protein